MKRTLFTLISISYFSTSMAQQYETQNFNLIKMIDKAEIRFYPPVMKIKSNRENGFSALFGYISGKNVANQRIAMTTPVYIKKNGEKEVMEFVLPRFFNKKDTPMPLSQKVEVYESQSGYYVAFPFKGYAFDWVTNKAINELKDIVNSNNLKIIGEPIILVYNSPYKLFNRKNEILFKIAYKPFSSNNIK